MHHGRVRDWCRVWAATVEQAQAGKAYFYMVHRQDWLDVEFIGIEEVGK